MLDFFAIFTKGGIVLWCFQNTTQNFTSSVNALIKNVILQERGLNTFSDNRLSLQYKLDNEFDLVFIVAYDKILKLSYVDKFLNDIHLEFRDKYKNELARAEYFQDYNFCEGFNSTLKKAEKWSKQQEQLPKQMKTFEQSSKSKKTVSSMIERKGDEKNAKIQKKKEVNFAPEEAQLLPDSPKQKLQNGQLDEETLAANRLKFAQKMNKKKQDPKKSPKSPTVEKERVGKKPRIWELGGTNKDLGSLERTTDKPEDMRSHFTPDTEIVGQMKGVIKDLEVESSDEEEYFEEEKETNKSSHKGGMFSIFKGLVGSKSLTASDMKPALEKMKDHLIAKNVASDIASKLCDSVATKLEGKVLGTFDSIASTVKNTLNDSLVQILSPKRRVDILRDCLEAQRQKRPFVMTFCGVNGVGKSTNLAKICFWLIENNLRVLIAACDTFRAGAVEQLRTHMKHLNALHPPERHNGRTMVQLYEKGYGKDAAGIAMEAIKFARDSEFDVVLVDTAGRMQDNEPLMRSLTKLIKVNEPDLVLFVGEALVGNEAVDQLVKFNQALADYSSNSNPHIIDGIVLTKFDTIDDKVGAAISMTYITGQPIVFVGTGQTYTDLKALNVKAVVHSLMK
ncbi:signal recognition particle receptor subunit alpha homolog [Harmonia axyridis]|uniref:signal recognition particle receptor subunit alpha homolog n=1 Tax=Harmonia axyridis TaxID=115357 RepID=UPI001E2770C5|nr:signal recognition particle receptor subunit alpha homolog [Harmonia axyridis]